MRAGKGKAAGAGLLTRGGPSGERKWAVGEGWVGLFWVWAELRFWVSIILIFSLFYSKTTNKV